MWCVFVSVSQVRCVLVISMRCVGFICICIGLCLSFWKIIDVRVGLTYGVIFYIIVYYILYTIIYYYILYIYIYIYYYILYSPSSSLPFPPSLLSPFSSYPFLPSSPLPIHSLPNIPFKPLLSSSSLHSSSQYSFYTCRYLDILIYIPDSSPTIPPRMFYRSGWLRCVVRICIGSGCASVSCWC